MKAQGVTLFITMTIVSMTLFSCRKKETIRDSPMVAARDFCDCMKKNGSPKRYIYAKAICDGEFVQRSRFYKIYTIDMGFTSLSPTTKDSVIDFIKMFNDYARKNCCNVFFTPSHDAIMKKKP